MSSLREQDFTQDNPDQDHCLEWEDRWIHDEFLHENFESKVDTDERR